jgi:U3 small nucleolar ribonucleoprotein protein LCP5
VDGDVAEGDSHRKQSRSSGDAPRRKNRSGEAVYRAPRLAATPYEEEAAAVKADKKAARRKDKLRKGEILETLQAEFGDRPEVVRAGAGLLSEQDRAAMDAEDSERRDFEEDHMIRLVSCCCCY